MHVSVQCRHLWGSEQDVQCLFQLLSASLETGSLSLNQNAGWLACELLGSPCLQFWGYTHAQPTRVLGTQTQVLMLAQSALSLTEPSPPLQTTLFLGMGCM